MPRNVLFVEVPSFYAMVERSLDPSLAERPVIVGGDPRKRGWVQAATPDALADGVAPDMPVSEVSSTPSVAPRSSTASSASAIPSSRSTRR